MNTLVTIIIYSDHPTEARKWAQQTLDIFAQLENAYSIHKSNSLLFTINEKGEGELDQNLLELWKEIEKWHELSERLFDPTVEPLMRLWGFYGGNAHLPSPEDIHNTLPRIGFSNIEKKGSKILLHGRRIDLGGILKGYALDRAAAFLQDKPIQGFLVNAGGNIIIGGKKNDKTDWTFGIRHPRKPNDIIALFSIQKGSIATSGDYEQFFITNGVRYHHIFDPHTGYPATNGVASVTVIAPTGVESDALSTVLFLLGKDKGIELANRLQVGVCYIMTDLTVVKNQFFPPISGTP